MSCKSQDYRLSRIKIEERRCTPLSFLMIQKLTFLERSQSFFCRILGCYFLNLLRLYCFLLPFTFTFFSLLLSLCHFIFSLTPFSFFLYLHLYLVIFPALHSPYHPFYLTLLLFIDFPLLILRTFSFFTINHPSSLYRPSPSHPPYLPLHFHPSSLIHLSFLLLFTSFSYFYYIPSSFLLIPSHSPLRT